MVGNPTVGNPMMGNPMAGNPMANNPMARPVAPVAPTAPSANPFSDNTSIDDIPSMPMDDLKTPEDSMVADSSKGSEGNDKKMLYVAVGCGVLALAGIGFGVFGMMKKPETKVETQTETVVSTEAANNIIAPYLTSLVPHVTIMDTELSDIAKVTLAYRNMPISGLFASDYANHVYLAL